MNFQFYLEKLHASDSFKKFVEENKDAFPCSCFFILDKKEKDSKQHFDYFIPSTKKMFSFKLEDNCEVIPVDLREGVVPTKLSLNYNFDFDAVEKLILDEMTKKEIKSKVEKMLWSLQSKDGKNYLLGTVFISMFGLLKVSIDVDDMKIVDFEKKSFMDMLKVTGKKKEE
jgi:hypothetical protein